VAVGVVVTVFVTVTVPVTLVAVVVRAAKARASALRSPNVLIAVVEACTLATMRRGSKMDLNCMLNKLRGKLEGDSVSIAMIS
jgi:hypothetical protein